LIVRKKWKKSINLMEKETKKEKTIRKDETTTNWKKEKR
jgi:hypothetical protein